MAFFYKFMKILAVLFILLWAGVVCVRIMKPNLYNAWKTKVEAKWNSWFKTHHMRDDGIL